MCARCPETERQRGREAQKEGQQVKKEREREKEIGSLRKKKESESVRECVSE